MTAALWALYRRELYTSVTAPLVYVVTAAFLAAISVFTLQIAKILDSSRADLAGLFDVLPWAFAVFSPALVMRAWALERRSGTLDKLLALPTPTVALAVGKFLAAWSLSAAALALSAPLWITVNALGAPDNFAIAVGYLGALLMAGGYLALSSAASAVTASPAKAFVVGAIGCVALTALGAPALSESTADVFGVDFASGVASFSPLTRLEPFAIGVIDLPAVIYFIAMIALGLTWTTLALDARRGKGGR